VAGAAVGLGVGYVVATLGRFGPHDAGILAAIFILGGAGVGLIVGLVAAYRFAIKPESN
jgi:hypothetical protein